VRYPRVVSRRTPFPALPLVGRGFATRALGGIVLAVIVLAEDRARAFVPPNAKTRTSSEMIYVPGAAFRFGKQAVWAGPHAGSAGFASDPEGVTVTIGSFFLDRTEVTVRAYAACVTSGACPEVMPGNDTNDCTYARPGLEEHPVNCVTFDEAVKFCASLGKRLPSEFEYELAERGPTARPFPWGDVPPTPKHVNACDASCVREEAKRGSNFTSLWADTGGDDGWPFTAPVATYPEGASPYGVLDLSGNVEEWVADYWGPIAATPAPAPSGTYQDHVVRGGSWDLGSIDAFASTRRSAAGKDTRTSWLGFRCARDG
jgi:formylglycine-generating enzyme required for sulfatase activity